MQSFREPFVWGLDGMHLWGANAASKIWAIINDNGKKCQGDTNPLNFIHISYKFAHAGNSHIYSTTTIRIRTFYCSKGAHLSIILFNAHKLIYLQYVLMGNEWIIVTRSTCLSKGNMFDAASISDAYHSNQVLFDTFLSLFNCFNKVNHASSLKFLRYYPFAVKLCIYCSFILQQLNQNESFFFARQLDNLPRNMIF